MQRQGEICTKERILVLSIYLLTIWGIVGHLGGRAGGLHNKGAAYS